MRITAGFLPLIGQIVTIFVLCTQSAFAIEADTIRRQLLKSSKLATLPQAVEAYLQNVLGPQVAQVPQGAAVTFSLKKDQESDSWYIEVNTAGFLNDPELLGDPGRTKHRVEDRLISIYRILFKEGEYEDSKMPPLKRLKVNIPSLDPAKKSHVLTGSLSLKLDDLSDSDARWKKVRSLTRSLFRADTWLHDYSNLSFQMGAKSPGMIPSAPQVKAVDELIALEDEKNESGAPGPHSYLLTAPVGFGKTFVVIQYLLRLKKEGRLNPNTKIVMIYQNNLALSLMKNFFKRVLKVSEGEIVSMFGLRGADALPEDDSFQVLLSSRTRYHRLQGEIHEWLDRDESSKLYFLDETHHLGAEAGEFERIIWGHGDTPGLYDLLDSNDRALLVSATPWHSNSHIISKLVQGRVAAPFLNPTEVEQLRNPGDLSLEDHQLLIQEIVRTQMFNAMGEGYLSPVTHFELSEYLGEDRIEDLLRGLGKIQVEEDLLSQLTIHQGIVDHIVERVLAVREDNVKDHGLVFVPSIQHANLYAALLNRKFKELGLKGDFQPYHSDLKPEQRDKTENWFISSTGKRHKYWVVVDAVREAVDIPMVNLIINVRNIVNFKTLVQVFGRGARSFVGKTGLRLIDTTGSFLNLLFGNKGLEVLAQGVKAPDAMSYPESRHAEPRVDSLRVNSDDFRTQTERVELGASEEPVPQRRVSLRSHLFSSLRDLMQKQSLTDRYTEQIGKDRERHKRLHGRVDLVDKGDNRQFLSRYHSDEYKDWVSEVASYSNKISNLKRSLINTAHLRQWTAEMWTDYMADINENGLAEFHIEAVLTQKRHDAEFVNYLIDLLIEDSFEEREKFYGFKTTRKAITGEVSLGRIINALEGEKKVNGWDLYKTHRNPTLSRFTRAFVESLRQRMETDPGFSESFRSRLESFVYNRGGYREVNWLHVLPMNGAQDVTPLVFLHRLYNELFSIETERDYNEAITVYLKALRAVEGRKLYAPVPGDSFNLHSKLQYSGREFADLVSLEMAIGEYEGALPQQIFTDTFLDRVVKQGPRSPKLLAKVMRQLEDWYTPERMRRILKLKEVENSSLIGEFIVSSFTNLPFVPDEIVQWGMALGRPDANYKDYLKRDGSIRVSTMVRFNSDRKKWQENLYQNWLALVAREGEIPEAIVGHILGDIRAYNQLDEYFTAKEVGSHKRLAFLPMSPHIVLRTLRENNPQGLRNLLPKLWPLFKNSPMGYRGEIYKEILLLIIEEFKEGRSYPLELAQKVRAGIHPNWNKYNLDSETLQFVSDNSQALFKLSLGEAADCADILTRKDTE